MYGKEDQKNYFKPRRLDISKGYICGLLYQQFSAHIIQKFVVIHPKFPKRNIALVGLTAAECSRIFAQLTSHILNQTAISAR